MSLLSSILITFLEHHIKDVEPQVANFVVNELSVLANDVVAYLDAKKIVNNGLSSKE